jgi:hypothetical protein
VQREVAEMKKLFKEKLNELLQRQDETG